MSWCRHWEGLRSTTCGADVETQKFVGPFQEWPCANKERPCEKRALPTQEEIAANQIKWDKFDRALFILRRSTYNRKHSCLSCGSTVDWSPGNGYIHLTCAHLNCSHNGDRL